MAAVGQQRKANGIATATKSFNARGRAAPEEFQVAVHRIGLHAMTTGVVDAQQAIRRQLDVQIRTGHDQPGKVAVFVPLSDAAEEFAGLIIAQHATIA